MACHGGLAELLLHITNLIYFCCGVAILVVGALMLGSPSAVDNMLSYIPHYKTLSQVMDMSGITIGPGIYLTCSGSLVIILCIIGCGGVFKRHKVIIFVFGIITLLLMLFNIAVIMFRVIDPYFVEPTIAYGMNQTLKTYFNPVSIASGGAVTLPSQSNAQAWATLQFELACCGVNSYSDYESFTWDNSFPTLAITSARVPPSCCLQVIQDKVATNTATFVNLNLCLTSAPSYTNTQGCINYMMLEYMRYSYIYTVVAAGLTGLQAIIITLTLWLITTKQTSNRVM